MTQSKKKYIKSIISNLLFFITAYVLINFWQNRNHIQELQAPLSQVNLQNLQQTSQPLIAENNTKPTILYFFAPWCSVCSLNTEAINNLYERNKFQMIAIAMDWSSIKELEDYQKKQDLKLPILLGTEEMRETFKIGAYPTFYYLNSKNQISGSSTGYTSELGMYVRAF